ncbi:MAG TPA: MFS transporter [Candidatus Acidoferrales bacterium]|nr:MFS transporter [Candidatus Acidoferrales bacterium]
MIRHNASPFRWLVLAVFVLSTAINMLDRATLAALAPAIAAEFHLSHEQYGWVTAAFNLPYALSAPFAGLLIDGLGLNRAITIAVALWSCAGIGTGLTRGLGGLAGCRAVLGVAEAAGIPGAGKAIHQYLRPEERALGNGVNQAGVSLGMMLAPLLATAIAVRSGWRAAFLVTGALGLLWIPVWSWTARSSGSLPAPKQHPGADAAMLRDQRLWIFVVANALSMMGYFLWFNFTQLFLVEAHRLTLQQAAAYAWIPPVLAAAGGFAGGWLSLRLVRRGAPAPAARFRVCLTASVLALAGAAIPAANTPLVATAGISLSIFAVAAFSVNMYTLPLDVFGAAPAAFAISILVASYGAISAAIGPVFGAIIDRHGYSPVILGVAVTPLAASGVLWITRSTR